MGWRRSSRSHPHWPAWPPPVWVAVSRIGSRPASPRRCWSCWRGDTATALLGLAAFTATGVTQASRPVAVVALFLLAIVFATLGGPSFAAIRALPPEGWRAAVVLAGTVAGVVCSFAAFHRSFAAMPAISAYLVIRVLLDLCGQATPEWWGIPLLLAGGSLAMVGAVQATRAASFEAVMIGLSRQHGGWMTAALGAAAVARTADLLPLVTLAASAALVHAIGYTLVASLAGLSLGTAEAAAGSQSLARLGGLAGVMPVSAIGMLVAGSSLALLPPSLGFAGGWLVLQALSAAPRAGGMALQLLLVAAVLMLAVSAGLGAVAVVRLGGTSFLGRPRTPRAAAAGDAAGPQRVAIIGFAVLCVMFGIFPGLLLWLVGPAQRVVSGGGLDGLASWAMVQMQPDSASYGPFWLALALALALTGIAVAARTGRLRGTLRTPPWEDGFAAPPLWMPFGDPATQADAQSFAEIASAVRGWRIDPAWLPRVRLGLRIEWPTLRPGHGVALLLAACVVLLLAVSLATPS